MAMNTKLTLYRWMPLILIGIMMVSSVSLLAGNYSHLNDNKINENTDARQGSPEDQLVAECEGITFEDMFVYTHALFDITINDDWKSADVWGIGWVNGSEAAEVRKDIDELLSNIPGNDASNPLNPNAQGNDGKYSTDERDALEDVGSACVEQTRVRFGLNDILHRDDGDWNNMSWVGDTLLLSDQEIECVLSSGNDISQCPITSVEVEDPTWEDGCDGKGDSDCQWVDVSSERNFVLWVHGTTTFNKIDYNSFTLAVNSTNISSASLKVTMPTTENPIRLGDTESRLNCDDEWKEEEATYTANCQSITDFEKQTNSKMVNNGNNYQFETDFAYDFSLWPATQHDFFDFTTAEPENNNPPEWTDFANNAGSIIPIMDKNSEQVIFSSELISSWYSDDYSAAQMNCFNGDVLLSNDNDGNIIMTPGDSTEIACKLVDGSQQESSSKIFQIIVPFSLSTSTTEITGDTIDLNVDPNEVGIEYVLGIFQGDLSENSESSLTTETMETISIDGVNSFKPGSVMVKVSFLASNNLAYSKSFDIDLGLSIPSTPPIVQITDYNWLDQDNDGIVDTYVLSGKVSDPDGEDVTLQITMNGAPAGTITITGAEWTSAGIPFYNYAAGSYSIEIEGCDSSNSCVTVEKTVTNLYWAEDITEPIIEQLPEPENSTPAPGVVVSLAAIAIALFASRKRES